MVFRGHVKYRRGYFFLTASYKSDVLNLFKSRHTLFFLVRPSIYGERFICRMRHLSFSLYSIFTLHSQSYIVFRFSKTFLFFVTFLSHLLIHCIVAVNFISIFYIVMLMNIKIACVNRSFRMWMCMRVGVCIRSDD